VVATPFAFQAPFRIVFLHFLKLFIIFFITFLCIHILYYYPSFIFDQNVFWGENLFRCGSHTILSCCPKFRHERWLSLFKAIRAKGACQPRGGGESLRDRGAGASSAVQETRLVDNNLARKRRSCQHHISTKKPTRLATNASRSGKSGNRGADTQPGSASAISLNCPCFQYINKIHCYQKQKYRSSSQNKWM